MRLWCPCSLSTNLCSVALRPARETVSMAASAAASVVKSAGFAVSNLEKSALARAFKPSNCALPPRRQPSGCRVKIKNVKFYFPGFFHRSRGPRGVRALRVLSLLHIPWPHGASGRPSWAIALTCGSVLNNHEPMTHTTSPPHQRYHQYSLGASLLGV